MVVPFAAGGPTDVIGRPAGAVHGTIARPERRGRGRHRRGAARIGVGRVAHAAPDGYTLSFGHWSTHVANGAIYALPYDLLKDLEPIALLPSNPMLIVTGSNT